MGKFLSSKVDYWLTDDGLLLLGAWARDGVNDSGMADKIGVSPAILNKWKDTYPEIRKALSANREIVDYKVENALLKSALGFTKKTVKVTIGKKTLNGETYELLKETTMEEIAPNVQACLAWLNNRKYDQWKRNKDRVVDIEDDNDISITIIRGKGSEKALDDSVNTQATFNTTAKELNDIQDHLEDEPEVSVDDLDEWSDWVDEE